jgi:phage terminase large subunit-like protein
MCVSNTTVVIDEAGNRKPSKRRSSGRIDGFVALAMAIGAAPTTQTRVIDPAAMIG